MAKSLLAVAGIVVLAVMALAAWRTHRPAAVSETSVPRMQVSTVLAPAVTEETGAEPDRPTEFVAEREKIVIPPLSATATYVPDDDLLKLSAIVNLANAEERHVNADQWSRALPIARRLAQGPCDCEQRNWLTHFIEMGDYALAGADERYYNLASMMRKMARSDKQLAEDPGRIVR